MTVLLPDFSTGENPSTIRHPMRIYQAGTLLSKMYKAFLRQGLFFVLLMAMSSFLEGGGGGKRADPGGKIDVCPGSGVFPGSCFACRMEFSTGYPCAAQASRWDSAWRHPGSDHRCQQKRRRRENGSRTVHGGAPECADLRHEGGQGKPVVRERHGEKGQLLVSVSKNRRKTVRNRWSAPRERCGGGLVRFDVVVPLNRNGRCTEIATEAIILRGVADHPASLLPPVPFKDLNGGTGPCSPPVPLAAPSVGGGRAVGNEMDKAQATPRGGDPSGKSGRADVREKIGPDGGFCWKRFATPRR